jgi:hypothetical protein
MARTRRSQLKLAIDFGGSSTKVMATTEDKSSALVMSPEAIEARSEYLDDYRQQLGADLLHRCFVGVGDRYFAVGSLAVSLGATQALKRLKSQTVAAKVLAVVSILANRWNLGRSFDLELGCLLPPGEFSDRSQLQLELGEALADFDTPLGGLKVDLKAISFYPEGFGIVHLYRLQRPGTVKFGVIMAGHRNISCYALQGDRLINPATCDLGFKFWIDLILEKTSGYELGSLTDAVAEYWLTKDEGVLEPILRSTKDRDRERQQTIETIASTKVLYWQAIQDWLADKLPTDIEEVMLSGGTADVLKTDFVDYLKPRLPLRPDCGNRPGIFNNRAFKLPPLDVPAAYQSRMADVYCLHEYLMPKSSTKKGNR